MKTAFDEYLEERMQDPEFAAAYKEAYECAACEGTGVSDQLANCRCCGTFDPPSASCYERCSECQGKGTVKNEETED